MSDDLKKHIQLVESQLNENPVVNAIRAAASLGQGSKKTARIMPDPEDDVIPSSRALTPATELPPSIDAEIAQRITVLKTINNLKDRQQILTQLDQAEGLLRAIDKLPEDMVRDALKPTGKSINNVRMLAKRMTRLKKQVEEAETMNRRVWREAVKEATQIKDAARKAAKAADVEAVSVVIRNAIAIASGAGVLGFIAAATLEEKAKVQESQLDESIFGFVRKLLGFGYTKQEAEHIAKTAAYLERSGVKGSNIEQLIRNADQYDAKEIVDQLRQLSKDDTPDALKVNRDTVDPNAVPDEKSITRDPVNVGSYSRFDPEDMNPYTGKPLTKAEQRLQKVAGTTVIFAAGVTGIVIGITGADVLLALQKPKDHDNERVKRMRAYIKDGFKAQAGWLKDLTGDQINALKDFARTGKYQHIDEEELTQRMEALRAKLEAEKAKVQESQLNESIFGIVKRLLGVGYNRIEAEQVAHTVAHAWDNSSNRANIKQLLKNANQYDADEMVAQIRQLSKDDAPVSLKVNRDTVEPIHDSLRDVAIDDIFRRGLNPVTGMKLTPIEKALSAASTGLALAGASVVGITLGWEIGRGIVIIYVAATDQTLIDDDPKIYKLVLWDSPERLTKDVEVVRNFMKETLPKVSKDMTKQAAEATARLAQGIFKVVTSVADEEAMGQGMKDNKEKLEQE